MTDYFALMGQPRRPWLDPVALRERFLTLSSTRHPDRVHAGDLASKQEAEHRSAELNAAYRCLKETKDRLKHLLTLERGHLPEDLHQVEPELLDLFSGVSQLCRQADAVLEAKPESPSPLLQVQWFGQAQECRERLEEVAKQLSVRLGKLEDALKVLSETWEETFAAQKEDLLLRLESVYCHCGFLTRWNAQLQVRILQLSL